MLYGFDIDGVVADFVGGLSSLFEEVLEREVSTKEVVDLLKWNTKEEEIDQVAVSMNSLYTTNTDFWTNIKPCCSEKDRLLVCQHANEHNDIIFITARPPKIHDQTLVWLENFGVEKPKLVSAVYSKSAICNGLNIAKYIDDRFFFAYDIAKNSIAKSYLYTTEYNEEHHTTKNGIKRAYTIEEIF